MTLQGAITDNEQVAWTGGRRPKINCRDIAGPRFSVGCSELEMVWIVTDLISGGGHELFSEFESSERRAKCLTRDTLQVSHA
jgi:hypothetical protein